MGAAQSLCPCVGQRRAAASAYLDAGGEARKANGHAPLVQHATPHGDAALGACCVDAGRFATCGEDKTAVLWNVATGKVEQRWSGHEKPVNRVAHSKLTRLFATASRDTTVKLWRADSGDAVATLSGHTLTVNGVAASDRFPWVVSGSRDYTVRFWDPETAKQSAGKKISRNLVTFLRTINDEPAVLQSSEDLQLRVWDARTCSVTQSFAGHANIPRCCDVSPDGLYFLSSANGFEGAGCEGRVWDRRTGKQVSTLTGHTFSADGCCLFTPPAGAGSAPQLLAATASADKSVKLWDALSGACIDTATFGDVPVVCVACCSDDGAGGSRLIAGNFAGALRVWSVSSGPSGLGLTATHALE